MSNGCLKPRRHASQDHCGRIITFACDASRRGLGMLCEMFVIQIKNAERCAPRFEVELSRIA